MQASHAALLHTITCMPAAAMGLASAALNQQAAWGCSEHADVRLCAAVPCAHLNSVRGWLHQHWQRGMHRCGAGWGWGAWRPTLIRLLGPAPGWHCRLAEAASSLHVCTLQSLHGTWLWKWLACPSTQPGWRVHQLLCSCMQHHQECDRMLHAHVSQIVRLGSSKSTACAVSAALARTQTCTHVPIQLSCCTLPPALAGSSCAYMPGSPICFTPPCHLVHQRQCCLMTHGASAGPAQCATPTRSAATVSARPAQAPPPGRPLSLTTPSAAAPRATGWRQPQASRQNAVSKRWERGVLYSAAGGMHGGRGCRLHAMHQDANSRMAD